MWTPNLERNRVWIFLIDVAFFDFNSHWQNAAREKSSGFLFFPFSLSNISVGRAMWWNINFKLNKLQQKCTNRQKKTMVNHTVVCKHMTGNNTNNDVALLDLNGSFRGTATDWNMYTNEIKVKMKLNNSNITVLGQSYSCLQTYDRKYKLRCGSF